MSQQIPLFDQIIFGTGVTVTKDDWYDLGNTAAFATYGGSYVGSPGFSPIPSGKQLYIGFGTFISEDKSIIMELRPNLPGQSTSGTANTQLRQFVSLNTGQSQDMDFFQNGSIITLAPIAAASTGVEKLWLRVRSGSATVSNFDFILYYTWY